MERKANSFLFTADIPVALKVLAWARSFLVKPHSINTAKDRPVSAAPERLAIGLTLAIMLLVPALLVWRMKASMYAFLDRAYPELARRLLRHEAVKHQLHSIRCRRRDERERVLAPLSGDQR
ncbi:MAG TPA: hypothetical protein VN841_12450 [Bryobacteraceae bacterium]|nr:hypothetical protein [Bryobacteraceae bacterium]